MGLSDVISTFATGTYTVTRRAASTYSNGVRVAGSTSTLSITASVQPVTGRELERLPEGMRTTEVVKLYTTTALRTADSGDPDHISIDGETYEVQLVERWTAKGYYKIMALKV